MATTPEEIRTRYAELGLGLILIDVLQAEEQGISVDELVERRQAAYEPGKRLREPEVPSTRTP